MSDLRVEVDGREVAPSDDHRLVIDDPGSGSGRLVSDQATIPVVVEGSGSDRVVTLAGRRVAVTVRTFRERLMAQAESTARGQSGRLTVKATLPGLVVALAVAAGDEVEEGAPLLTLEAMKMQNEVRAPRAGRVVEVAAEVGQAVRTGAPLVTLE